MTRKKKIALLLACLTGTGIMSAADAAEHPQTETAEEMDTYDLPEVTVVGLRRPADTTARRSLPGGFQAEQTNFGLMGDRDVMQVPYTAQSLTTKNFDTFSAPSGDVNQVLANVPSLRVGTSLIKTDFSARGMLANGSAMYLNNVPGFFIMAAGPVTNTIGRADVMVGPAATLSGSVQSYNGPDGGQPVSVYLYTKRPEKGDFTRYRQTIGGYGHYGGYIDVNRSGLGDGTFGVRVYGEHSEGNFAVSGAGRQKTNLFVDVSRETPKSTTNFFGGYYKDRLRGTERRFQIQRAARQVPNAPDAGRSYDDPNLMHSDWDGYQITLNHEQRINPHTKWFLNAGTNDMTNRRFIYWSQITIDGDGNLRNNQVWSQYFYLKSRYGQVGVNHKFKTGAAEHDVTLAVDRSWRVQYNNTRRDAPNAHVTGNIYSGIIYKPSIYSYDISGSLGQKFQYQEMDTSINLMDNVKIGKWNLLAAVTRRHGNYRGAAAGSETKDTQYAPTFGVTYAPTDRLSVYGAYAKATTRGQVVGSGYVNEGAILPAVKVTQKEVGVKYKFGSMYAALAYFDVNQPNYVDVANPAVPGTKFRRLDGENRYRGLDLSVTGAAAPKWNVFGGIQYLRARQQRTQGGANDGLPTDSSAPWSAVVGLEYMPNADWTITGRMNYVSRGTIIGTGRRELSVPSSAVFDLFASYRTKIGTTPVSVQASVYNVFNRSYWILQPGQGSKLLLSMPRTFMLSATFDL